MDQAAFTSLMKSFVASGGSAQSAQSPAHDHDEQPASKVKVWNNSYASYFMTEHAAAGY